MQRIRPKARSRYRTSKSATCWVKAKVRVVVMQAISTTRKARAPVVKALAAKLARRKAKVLAVRKMAKTKAAKVAAAAPLKFLHT